MGIAPPRGERRGDLDHALCGLDDFNPRSPRGERRLFRRTSYGTQNISIHAPRGGSDKKKTGNTGKTDCDFNPRSPRGERRLRFEDGQWWDIFQSTLPAGGATRRTRLHSRPQRNFNPRSPRGERHDYLVAVGIVDRFQSTLPAGGATQHHSPSGNPLPISIHAPRGGSDCKRSLNGRSCPSISIHAPRGGSDPGVPGGASSASAISIHAPRGGSDEDIPNVPGGHLRHFNPRSPRGERPITLGSGYAYLKISIHAPRGGSDRGHHQAAAGGNNFNPRSPRGERPSENVQKNPNLYISIHAPRGGSDALRTPPTQSVWIFQSTLPAGGATAKWIVEHTTDIDFNPRSPRGERLVSTFTGSAFSMISIHAPRGGSDP